jgi:hypothetical protein
MGRREGAQGAEQQRDEREGGVRTSVRNVIVTALGIALAAALVAGGTRLIDGGGPAPAPARYLSVTAKWWMIANYCTVGRGWVFPVAMSELPYPSATLQDPEGLETWAADNGGLPASGNSIAVTLQGLGHHTVIVQELRVKVVHRAAPPATATYPNLAWGCGGGIAPNYFSVNLDQDPTVIHEYAGFTPGVGRVPPVPLPHQVSESRPEVWHLRVITTDCACSWVGYIDWTSDGVSRTTKISDHGRPFLTVTPTRAMVVRPLAYADGVSEAGEARGWAPAAPKTPAEIEQAVLAGEQPNF